MPHRADNSGPNWRAVIIAAMLFLTAVPNAAQAFDIAELMTLLARVDESNVAFDETKYVSTLTAPIVRHGTMRYVRPDRLEMRVESPYFERMEIVGDTLTIETRRGIRQIDLGSQPGAAAWVASIRATLAGDGASLAAHFRVTLSGDIAHWSIALDPVDAALANVIARIVIDGAQAQVLRIGVNERGGDRTALVVRPPGDGKR
jgi:Outer membrane lipoprotein carrier protein LolA-like